jgi:hypothetical protein
VNPIYVSPYEKDKQWADYMADDIKALFECDAIYMLSDWGQSKGARVEYAIAKELGLIVIHEAEFSWGLTDAVLERING